MPTLPSKYRRRGSMSLLAVLLAAIGVIPNTFAITFNENFNSRPGSPNVLYLDFRGTITVARSDFNNGLAWDYPPINLEAPYIEQVCEWVAEYYRQFDLNVTTNFSVYQNATHTSKARMRITPKEMAWNEETKVWAERTVHEPIGIGGVFGLGAFKASKQSIVGEPNATADQVEDKKAGWAFFNPGSHHTVDERLAILYQSIAHEFGHAIGLEHWGTDIYDLPGKIDPAADYYPVQKSKEQHGGKWAPMMGQTDLYRVNQWSKGEYLVDFKVGCKGAVHQYKDEGIIKALR